MGLLAGVMLAWLVLQVQRREGVLGAMAVRFGGIGVLFLFLVHKLPRAVGPGEHGPAQPVLSASASPMWP